VVDQSQPVVSTALLKYNMVDDDHVSTLCQVTGKCKSCPHCRISVISKLSSNEAVATEVYDSNKRKHITWIIPLLTNAENL